MIKKLVAFVLIILGINEMAIAQELYIFTEPASNMPTSSIGLRLTNEGSFTQGSSNRLSAR